MTDPSSSNEPEPLGEADARRLTRQIAERLSVVWGDVVEAYRRRADRALGYGSWDEYCRAEFGTLRLRLPAEERAVAVQSLRAEGLSTRAIAAATGASKDTVNRVPPGVSDETPAPVIGQDGKSYQAARPRPDVVEPSETPAPPAQPVVPVLTPTPTAAESPPPPRPARRASLVQSAASAGWALREHVDRVEALLRDDRYPRHRGEIDTVLRAHLLHAADRVNQALGALPAPDKETAP